MRFLTVGNMYPPHHQGGYELIWQSADDHLRSNGHEVRVLTTTHREPGIEASDEGDVHRELRWYWRDHGFPPISLRRRIELERANANVLDRHLADFEPDAIGWWAMGGMSLSLIERARRAGLPAAGFVCDDWMTYGPRVDAWTRAFDRPVLRSLVGRLTGMPVRLDLDAAGPWVFLSDFIRRAAVERWGLSDTEVAHDGVDAALFRPAEPREWSWRLAYVGRVDPRKGVELAIRSLTHLPDAATLEVVGGGDAEYLAELGRLAADLGLSDRVRFAGPVAREELPDRYSDADAILFPVLWEEPWGLVPLEAMAVGVPVIASGRGGSGEYLRDGENCLLFDPDRGPAALAAEVQRLAATDETRAALREAGFETSRGIKESDFEKAVEAALTGAVRTRAGNGRPRAGR